MPRRLTPAARFRRIPLADVLPRRERPYKLSPRMVKALTAHIAATGLYPPLIVRPLPDLDGKFEIIDGHQRAAVLAGLGYSHARCETWALDDDQAEIFAATLNHIRGRPDARLRARQVGRLVRRYGQGRATELLALTPAAIRQHRTVLSRPGRPSASGGLDLRAVTFHLSAADVQVLERTLRSFGPGSAARGRRLMAAIRQAGRRRGRDNGPKQCPT